MIHYVVIGATGLVGALGVVGAIAAVVACLYLGPAATLAIAEPIFAKFIACTKCVVSVAVVLIVLAAYWVGHHEAANECRAAEENSAQAAKEQDAAITQKAATDEINLAEPIEAKSNERHKNDVVENEALKARPGCAFDDTDAGSGADTGGVLPTLHATAKNAPARAKSLIESFTRRVPR